MKGGEKQFSQKAFRAWAAAVVAAAVLVYSGTLSYPFLHDDITVIGLNPIVQEKGRALEAFSADYWGMREGDSQRDRLYRPLTTLTLIANHALGGNAPAGYRAFNILMHALVSFLLLLLGLRIGLSLEGAGAAAFLFALHPVHTEAVNAVVGRADLLAAAGMLGGMAILMSGAFGMGEASGKRGENLPLLAGLLFALALLAKESGAALILWAGIWWAWCRVAGAGPLRMDDGILRRSALALGAVLAAYVAMRYWALGMLVRPVPPSLLDNVLAHEETAGRVLGALSVLGRYFGLLLWPWPLTIDYSYSQILPTSGASALWATFGASSLAAWGAAAWRWRSARPEVAFGLGLFLAAYFPASNLAVPIGTAMAERLMYIPSAGFLIALAPAAAEFSGRRGGQGVPGRACGGLPRICRDELGAEPGVVRLSDFLEKGGRGFTGQRARPPNLWPVAQPAGEVRRGRRSAQEIGPDHARLRFRLDRPGNLADAEPAGDRSREGPEGIPPAPPALPGDPSRPRRSLPRDQPPGRCAFSSGEGRRALPEIRRGPLPAGQPSYERGREHKGGRAVQGGALAGSREGGYSP